jgi:hypothetical protein
VSYLPKGFAQGFGMRAGRETTDSIFERQLRADGYDEVTAAFSKDETTWKALLPWVTTVGTRRYFAPEWLRTLVSQLWIVMCDERFRAPVLAFLNAGHAAERAKAMLAAADLAEPQTETARAVAALVVARLHATAVEVSLKRTFEPATCPCGTPGCPTGPECFGGSDYP